MRIQIQKVNRSCLAVFFAAATMSGCANKNMNASAEKPAESPFVQGYFEYVAPAERWAGPRAVLLRIEAEPGKDIQAQLSSGFENAELTSLGLQAGAPLTSESIRAQLEQISKSLDREDAEPARCLGQVRVHLFRADHSIVLRTLCRDRTEGSRITAEILQRFSAQAIRSASVKTATPARISGSQQAI